MGGYLGAAATLLGLLVLLGAAYAVLTSAKTTRLLELYQREAEAEKVRGDRLEHENEELTRRVGGLEAANRILVETVSGTIAVKELETLIEIWRTEESGLLTAMIEKQSEILDHLPKRVDQENRLIEIHEKIERVLDRLPEGES